MLQSFLPVLDRGVPIFIVPGDHERSALPAPLYWQMPGLHVFDEPRTFVLETQGRRIVLSGFPYHRGDLRRDFPLLLRQAGWDRDPADVRLLCIHQAVEGATVGPKDFVFRDRPDVIPGRLLPDRCDAVLAGHIHRHQILQRDPAGRRLPAPVFYPGAPLIEQNQRPSENNGFSL